MENFISAIGYPTPDSTFLNMESHKLHLAFVVDPTLPSPGIMEGQPVKLNALGQITPLLAADDAKNCIGYAIMNFDPTLINTPTFRHVECTVAVKGYARINGVSNAAVVPGLVKYAGFNTNLGYNQFVNAGANDTPIGFSLEPAAAAGDEIEVLYL